MHASQRQRFFDYFLHRAFDRSRRLSGTRLELELEQVRLNVRMGGVEYQVELGLRGHFWNIIVTVHDLSDVENLLG